MISPALRYARANSGITFRPDANCVLWYPGQDDAYSTVIRDRSGKGNHGTLVGTTWSRQSKGLWATLYDGNDYINVPDKANLDMTTALTLMAWAKQTTVVGNKFVISKRVEASDDAYTMQLNAAKYPMMQLYIGGAAKDAIGTTIFPDNTWTFLCGVYNATDIRFYFNGVLNCTPTVQAGSIDVTVDPVRIGWGYNATYGWPGLIALPKIYNRALSAPEILNHYNQERVLFGV